MKSRTTFWENRTHWKLFWTCYPYAHLPPFLAPQTWPASDVLESRCLKTHVEYMRVEGGFTICICGGFQGRVICPYRFSMKMRANIMTKPVVRDIQKRKVRKAAIHQTNWHGPISPKSLTLNNGSLRAFIGGFRLVKRENCQMGLVH